MIARWARCTFVHAFHYGATFGPFGFSVSYCRRCRQFRCAWCDWSHDALHQIDDQMARAGERFKADLDAYFRQVVDPQIDEMLARVRNIGRCRYTWTRQRLDRPPRIVRCIRTEGHAAFGGLAGEHHGPCIECDDGWPEHPAQLCDACRVRRDQTGGAA